MIEEVPILKREGESLAALLEMLKPDDWEKPTPFKGWTPWDVLGHLHISDQWGLAALKGREAFQEFAAPALEVVMSGKSLRVLTREHFAGLDGAALLKSWRKCFDELIERFSALDPKARLAWFGPDMGARMFVTARYMETWAHGQDIYDLLAKPRVYTDDIRAIATIGVKTYGFTFINRKLTPPEPEPYVRLTAPSGAIWEWNEPSTDNFVEGLASEFCHVVTQGRNIADTHHNVRGEPATRWMAIAQCFAGLPENPPAPGTRVPKAAG